MKRGASSKHTLSQQPTSLCRRPPAASFRPSTPPPAPPPLASFHASASARPRLPATAGSIAMAIGSSRGSGRGGRGRGRERGRARDAADRIHVTQPPTDRPTDRPAVHASGGAGGAKAEGEGRNPSRRAGPSNGGPAGSGGRCGAPAARRCQGLGGCRGWMAAWLQPGWLAGPVSGRCLLAGGGGFGRADGVYWRASRCAALSTGIQGREIAFSSTVVGSRRRPLCSL